MKKIKLLYIVSLSVLILFASCKKEVDGPSSTIQAEEYFINAKIDGVELSTTEVLVSAFPDLTEFYTINSYGDNDNRITLTIEGQPELGTFSPAVGNEFTSLYYTQVDPAGTWFAIDNFGSGTITITENSATSISGSFSFIGEMITDSTSMKTITEGSFKAKKL